MKIATWNVNSVRARLERLLAWLQKAQPDMVCLQELKAKEAAFPYAAIREAGYHAAVLGQPTFNGVGILSRIEPQNVRHGMDDGAEDQQARSAPLLRQTRTQGNRGDTEEDRAGRRCHRREAPEETREGLGSTVAT